MIRMDMHVLSDEYEYSHGCYLSSNLAVIDRILCISYSPSNKHDEDRDGTCLPEMLEECQTGQDNNKYLLNTSSVEGIEVLSAQ